jgi:threonine dehydrogenase-like Zn-dependent dehydrogenase
MRALILDDYRRLSVHEVAEPEPSPTEVLVEIAAVGICGTDVHGFIGANGRRIPGQLMGHEASGRVVAVGAAVDDVLALSPGDPVVLNPLVGCGRCFACRRGQPQRCPDRLSIGSTATLPVRSRSGW